MRYLVLFLLLLNTMSFASTVIILRGPDGQPIQAKVEGNVVTDMHGNPLSDGTYQGPKNQSFKIENGVATSPKSTPHQLTKPDTKAPAN